MTAPVRRRTSFRGLVALGAVALLALLALALVAGGAFGDHDAAGATGTASTVVAVDGHEHDAAPAVHALHQQPSTHARSVALAVLVAVAVGAPAVSRRLRLARADQPRVLRTGGLPPGRAPPALRIA
jgi:hypothetical protein